LPQRLHQRPRRIGLRRRNQQVDVVGHENISMNLTSGFIRVLAQPVEIETVILIGIKARLPVVASLRG
jgi:hypothetical protein